MLEQITFERNQAIPGSIEREAGIPLFAGGDNKW